MPADRSLPSWAQRLIELRRARAWSPADLAHELKKRRDGLPSVRSLAHMIQLDWETGKHRPGPRYRLLLGAVYDTDEQQTFGDQAAADPRSHRNEPDGPLTDVRGFTGLDGCTTVLVTAAHLGEHADSAGARHLTADAEDDGAPTS